MKKTITLFHPHMSVKVIKPLSRVLMGRWIGQGPKVKELEAKFKNKYRLPYVISVNNCTAALHLSLILAGVKDKDEVITTPHDLLGHQHTHIIPARQGRVCRYTAAHSQHRPRKR